MSKLALFIKVKTKPGKREEVRALWEQHLKPRAIDNKNQEVYFYCYDHNDENVIFLFELYQDKKEFEANAQTEWFALYMQKVTPLLEGQPEVSLTNPIWGKGVKI